MLEYIIKRILAMVPTIFGITVITFLLIQLAPGNPAEFKIRMAKSGDMDPEYTAEVIKQTRELYGLDDPLHVQYWSWLQQIFTLDFGTSYKDHQPVTDKILERVPVSLQLSLISIFLVYFISVPLGVLSSVKQRSWSDRAITLFLFILYSVPNFWAAMMLITLFGGGDLPDWLLFLIPDFVMNALGAEKSLDLFPIYGLSSDGASQMGFWEWLLDRTHHLVLPVACLTYTGLAFISRQMRGSMLEVIRQDYIQTARAKGLAEKTVIMKHAFRNSLIPIITLLAYLFPAIIGGSVIIEQIFSIPGMGKLSFEAILSRDYPVIMGITTIAAFLTLLGILVADLAYTLVDPRITFGTAPLTLKPKQFLAGLAAVAAAIVLVLYSGELYLAISGIIIKWGWRGPLVIVLLVFIRGLARERNRLHEGSRGIAYFLALHLLKGVLAVEIAFLAVFLFFALQGGLGSFIIVYGGPLGALVVGAVAIYLVYLLAVKRAYWAMVLKQFSRDRWALAALFGVLALFIVALLSPLLANNKPLMMRYKGELYFPAFRDYLPEKLRMDYKEFSVRRIDEVVDSLGEGDYAYLAPIPWAPAQIDKGHSLHGPGPRHLLGTDDSGRDVLSRIVHGSKIALSVGFVAVGIYVFIGLVLGSLAGYYGGTVDMVISRLIEVMLSIPALILIIAVIAFLQPSIYNVMAAIGLVGWTNTARLVRGEFLKLRNQDFVEASRGLGATDIGIIVKHVMPNALTPVLVVATFGVAEAILIESSLSFLGFGVQPPTPSWGDILRQSNLYYESAWWLTFFPGLAIFFTVTALNLVGEGIRDAIDPRLKDTG